MSSKQAILVVSFGTSHEDTREKTIGAIENHIKDTYPEMEVRRAFTSGMILKVIKNRDGVNIDNVPKAMKRLIKNGYKNIFVQPTHILHGEEYDKMTKQLLSFSEQLESLTIGRPLLSQSTDYEIVCNSIMHYFPKLKSDEVLVLMGHGTTHFADAAYAALDYRFKALGFSQVFVGTVEGYPRLENVVRQIIRINPKKVILFPLMIVAGDHAINDMASDEEDSWKRIFENEGYTVECVLKGLGELEEIRDLYLSHIAAEMKTDVR